MDFVFVGSETDWQQARLWFTPASQHRVVQIVAEPPAVAWTNWPTGVRRHDQFEPALFDPALDGLIVAGPIEQRAELIRRAVRAGRLCLCAHPADTSAIFYHEAAMIAEQTKAVLVPMLPGRRHPAWTRLRELLDGSGTLQAVAIERSGAVSKGVGLVMGTYAEAADLLAALLDPIAEVTATGEIEAGRLVVHHRSLKGVSGEIRLLPGPEKESCRIRAEAHGLTVQLDFPDGLFGTGRLTWTSPPVSLPTPHAVGKGAGDEQVDWGRRRLGLIDELFQTGQGSLPAGFPSWEQATAAAELGDCVLHSLQRRRTVEVYHEKHSELASFKGLMTSCGCGLLWACLFCLVLFSAASGLGIPGIDWFPVSLLVMLVIFILLQALRWLVPR